MGVEVSSLPELADGITKVAGLLLHAASSEVRHLEAQQVCLSPCGRAHYMGAYRRAWEEFAT